MDEQRLRQLLYMAQKDISQGDFSKARDRMKAVLENEPLFNPALELLGQIYYAQGDWRNAVMYWSRAGHWNDPMPTACEKVFHAVRRVLVREKPAAVRHYLYAFAGSNPPKNTAERLKQLQTAYYHLERKESRFAGLSCAPVSGGCLILMIALATALFGAGWGWFAWMGAVACTATIIVACINSWSYFRASRQFRASVDHFSKYNSEENTRLLH